MRIGRDIRRLFPGNGRIEIVYREGAGPYSLSDMSRVSEERLSAATVGHISPGSRVAVNIGVRAHSVGLYVSEGRTRW